MPIPIPAGTVERTLRATDRQNARAILRNRKAIAHLEQQAREGAIVVRLDYMLDLLIGDA